MLAFRQRYPALVHTLISISYVWQDVILLICPHWRLKTVEAVVSTEMELDQPLSSASFPFLPVESAPVYRSHCKYMLV